MTFESLKMKEEFEQQKKEFEQQLKNIAKQTTLSNVEFVKQFGITLTDEQVQIMIKQTEKQAEKQLEKIYNDSTK